MIVSSTIKNNDKQFIVLLLVVSIISNGKSSGYHVFGNIIDKLTTILLLYSSLLVITGTLHINCNGINATSPHRNLVSAFGVGHVTLLLPNNILFIIMINILYYYIRLF